MEGEAQLGDRHVIPAGVDLHRDVRHVAEDARHSAFHLHLDNIDIIRLKIKFGPTGEKLP